MIELNDETLKMKSFQKSTLKILEPIESVSNMHEIAIDVLHEIVIDVLHKKEWQKNEINVAKQIISQLRIDCPQCKMSFKEEQELPEEILGSLKEKETEEGKKEKEEGEDTGMTPLMLAAQVGDINMAQELLKKNAKVNLKGLYGNTALIVGAMNGHVAMVKFLLQKGAPIDQTNDNMDTPLMYAAARGHAEVVELLLEKGASITRKNRNHGATALVNAVNHHHLDVIDLLWGFGARSYLVGWRVSLVAPAGKGHLGEVYLLLKTGRYIDETGTNDETALMLAAKNGHVDVVKFLLDQKGCLNKTNKHDETALMLAAKNGHVDVVKFLLAREVLLNETNKDGETALMLAVKNNHVDIIKLLLNQDVQLHKKDKDDRTALQMAWSKEQYAVALLLMGKILESTLESFNIEEIKGFLIDAVKKSYSEDINLVKVLLEYEAKALLGSMLQNDMDLPMNVDFTETYNKKGFWDKKMTLEQIIKDECPEYTEWLKQQSGRVLLRQKKGFQLEYEPTNHKGSGEEERDSEEHKKHVDKRDSEEHKKHVDKKESINPFQWCIDIQKGDFRVNDFNKHVKPHILKCDTLGFTPIDCVLLFNPKPVEVIRLIFRELDMFTIKRLSEKCPPESLPQGFFVAEKLTKIKDAYKKDIRLRRVSKVSSWIEMVHCNSRLDDNARDNAEKALQKMSEGECCVLPLLEYFSDSEEGKDSIEKQWKHFIELVKLMHSTAGANELTKKINTFSQAHLDKGIVFTSIKRGYEKYIWHLEQLEQLGKHDFSSLLLRCDELSGLLGENPKLEKAKEVIAKLEPEEEAEACIAQGSGQKT